MTSCSDCTGYESQLIYPSGIRVFIDDIDITQWSFGVDQLTPDEALHAFKDIDISQFITSPGDHVLKITSETPGRIDTRIQIR